MTTGREENLKVPDAKKLPHVQKLCDIHEPYTLNRQRDELFVSAMREVVTWHLEHNSFYKRLCELEKFDVKQLHSISDCVNIPAVPANFFKLHEVTSIPQELVHLHLTSSGTTGQKSQMYFDKWSILSAQRMVDWIFDFYQWGTPNQAANYVLYSYQTTVDSKLGTAFTDHYLCKFAPVNEVFTTLRLTGSGGHDFDVFGTIAAFQRFAQQDLPVRIFGFPAFLYFTLERMQHLNIAPLKLRDDSLIFLGGGWKGHADKAIEKRDLYKLVSEQLGIPDHRIRDGFGSVEHCVPYIECKNHQFHIPVWSRVFIRDLKDLTPLPYGEKGFLSFVSPYITSAPAHSVIMGDLASLYPGESCNCGLSTPYFIVHGRAGTSKNKSCAVAASELLKRAS